MDRRKMAFKKGLENLTRQNRPTTITRTGLYNGKGIPEVNQVVRGNCIDVLNAGPEGWVDLVFADPPFNIGYLYHGYDDRLKTNDYLKFSTDWMQAVHRCLKPRGSFYLAIGDAFAADLCVIAKRELGFHLRNWIIWHYTFGQQAKNMFAKSHTHILYFTKDAKEFTFNPDSIRVKSARQTTYGDARANPKGKLPDDVWYLRPQETEEPMFAPEGDTWNVSRVCGTFKEREGWHGCQMPIAVLDRVIKSSSNPGDIVLDPFIGSGTTVVSAALQDRKYVGIDLSDVYVEYAQKRVGHAVAQIKSTSAAQTSATVLSEKIATKTRSSRVLTGTDSLGRERVSRKSASRAA
jgi:site-specific DNA-methyltransferase (adenine-specific)